MMTQPRIAIRLERFEVLAAVLTAAALSALALLVSFRLGNVGLPSDCWGVVFGDGGTAERVAACQAPVRAFLEINESEASRIMAAMALVPLAIGLILGVPAVGREIEAGTASLAWTIGRSRTRWLLWRLLALATVTFVILSVLAISSEILWASRAIGAVPNRFDDAGAHGPVVVARGLAAFGIGALMGAILGRVLPALIAATVLVLVVTAGALLIRGIWEGRLSELESTANVAQGETESATWLFDNSETILFGGIGLGALALTFPVVNRRRQD
jgi:hypothetical protein